MPIAAVAADGRALTLTERVGSGATGGVYRVQGSPLLAKLIVDARDGDPTARKIDRLVRQGRSPRTVRLLDGRARADHRPRAAWPLARVAVPDGGPVGFLMADLGRWYQAFDVFFAVRHRRAALPDASWATGLAAAQHLSRLVADLHAEDYVIGDFQAGNLWLDAAGRVAICDVDSFQFSEGDSFFGCALRSPGYTAPELLAEPRRMPDARSDRFALGVLIHQLLMCGAHPFGGVGLAGDYRGLDDNVARRRTRLLDPAALRVAPGTPPVALLPRCVRTLLRRCFAPDPRSRPSAQEWHDELTAYRDERPPKQCPVVSTHEYAAESPWCPWCDLLAAGADCFPAPRAGREDRSQAPKSDHV